MVDWAYVGGCPDDRHGDAELEVPGAGLDRLGEYPNGVRPSSVKRNKGNKSKNDRLMCPKCGAKLIERNGKFGAFYGCSKFPECKGTMSK